MSGAKKGIKRHRFTEPKKLMSVMVPEELHRRIRLRAAQESVSANKLIIDAIQKAAENGFKDTEI